MNGCKQGTGIVINSPVLYLSFIRERSHDDEEDCDLSEGHHYNGIERSYDHKSYRKMEKSISHSEDGSSKGSRRQYRDHNRKDYDMLSVDGQRKSSHLVVDGRDQKPYHHRERSSSEVDDCSSCQSEEKHKQYHRSSRKHKERREPCGSDSSRSHHKDTSKKGYSRKMIENDSKRHNPKHRSHSGSVIEQSVSSDKKLQKVSSRSSGHSKCSAKCNPDEAAHDRWKMVCGSDEDGAEGYQYCRWKRKH